MKTLTLLRHAKSGWDDPQARDFDRTLNARGRRAAQAIGRHLRDEGAGFDHVIASPAVRVVETLSEVAGGYGQPLNPIWDRRAYLASAEMLLDLIRAVPDEQARVLLVGHNPGLEDLVLLLVPAGTGPRGDVQEKFPTASVATLDYDGAWSALAESRATLQSFVRPRDLDVALGPDGS